MRRFFAWFLWSALFGLVPYGIAAFVYWFSTGALLTWTQLLGAGQVMLTSAALLGGGLKELSQVRDAKFHYWRVFLIWAAAVFLLLIGVAYGMIAASTAGATLPLAADRVVLISSVAYPVSLLAAATALIITNPVAAPNRDDSFERVGG